MKKLLESFACFCFLAFMAMPAAARDAPGHYAIGDFDIMAMRDADTTMEKSLLPDLGKFPEFEGVFANGPVPGVAQTFYFKNGDRNVLVDAGWGNELKIKGKTAALLREAGIAPEAITDILLTHMDFDHIGGLLANGKPVYPNATLWISRPEYESWTGGAITSRPQHARDLARRVASAYDGRIRLFNYGDEIMPGVTSVDASGHTPGHTAYDIVSGNDKMTIAGDILHVAAVQLPKPELSTIYDIDREQAAVARQRLLERAVAEKAVFAGMHFPMISNVRKHPAGGFVMMQPR